MKMIWLGLIILEIKVVDFVMALLFLRMMFIQSLIYIVKIKIKMGMYYGVFIQDLVQNMMQEQVRLILLMGVVIT